MTISGKDYIDRIDQLKNEVWINGKKIQGKISRHDAFKGVLKSKAALYDLQLQPEYEDILTYPCTETNSRIGFSFQQPVDLNGLEIREKATKIWARTNAGLLGRSPDYVNTGIMALGTASALFGETESKYGNQMAAIYESAKLKDISFTHTLINPQVNRSITYFEDSSKKVIAAKIIEEKKEGIIIHGARLLATQGGITDEVLVLPAGGNFIDDSYIYAFTIASNTPGIKFICRESFVLGDSSFDYPLSSRFEEMDTIVVFDHVLVPWERVFLYKDMNIAVKMFGETNLNSLLLYQAVSRMIVKTEFILGLAEKIVDAIQIGDYQHVKDKVSEIIVSLEILKGLQLLSRHNAKPNKWGTMIPDTKALNSAILFFPKMYPRFVEILQLISGSGLITLPSSEDFSSSIRGYLDSYLQGANIEAKDRVQLFRLAWDLTMSPFGTRQTQYERFFFGDPVRLSMSLYNSYPKEEFLKQVESLLF
ncbi:4-hydroxyphenylacetate 3-monooxygenase, oxygenase component [Heyndrickxia acidicola]|uniref:4-hydroxyphenylacetate 3-monooxygenase, oxygenase component n=1 Tax=Heyndrickxia acidicola TaxID=209389 RepID=A0ABU6MEV1_9BACI|nr:4-hydroxyphenylacetate 3-monooxygenase, oxygenase component [Heyndrickxia acidicola]MED1201570.1 4-hydroxyphenylacetate 3-monooxygenase, oxygenase component [Heyndrickxia acidicola]